MRKFFVALLALCVGSIAQAGEITIQGRGESKGEPDQAVIAFTVSVTMPKMEDAVKICNKDMQAAFVTLEKTFQIEKRNIQTSQFGISHVYPDPVKDPLLAKEGKIIGYRVTNRISVLIDIKQLSEALGVLSKIPNSMIDHVFFAPSDALRQKLLVAAREAAMKDAMEKAKQYAEGAGLKVGKAKTITEGREEPAYRQFESVRSFGAGASADRVPISGGETKFVVSVQVIFELAE